jgi:hypothetical protein
MTTHGDMVYQLGGVPVGGSEPFLAAGKWYFCDPTNGTSGGDGLTPATATSNLSTAYGYCRDGYNDGVIFIAGATSYAPTATLTWSKSYCHLIGTSAPLQGVGQRCRVVGTSGNDLTEVITLSGSGCIFKNIQIANFGDADADAGAMTVSGSRNLLLNCFVAGMGHATPAARAGSYSMKVSGAENNIVNSTVGLDTIVRAAANSELHVSGERNRFIKCDVRSNSVTAGKFLVKIDNSGGDIRDTIFDDCLFVNYTTNWATGITNAFDMPAAGATHNVILRGNCQVVGVGTGWADTVTHIYGAGPAPNAGYGISINPTT